MLWPKTTSSTRWSWIVILVMSVLCTSPVFAQEDDKDPNDKPETKIKAESSSKLQTKAPTLKNERKGTAVIRAEEFGKRKKFESMKKIDDQIVRLRTLIKKAPKGHPDIAEFKFNLAELYWAKSKKYQNGAFEEQDRCAILEDQGKKKKVKACKRRMKMKIDESKRLRGETIQLYVAIAKEHKDFKYLDQVYYYLGANLMELGQRAKALNVFRELIRSYPKSKFVPNVLVAFGDYYFDADEMGDALKAYDKVASSYKNSAVYGYAVYKKAWCYYNMDNKEKALDLFLATLKHADKNKHLPNSKPLRKQATKDIVMTFAHVGAASKAIPFFKKITKNNKKDWLKMGERLAVFYGDKGKFEDSMSMYRELIKLNRTSAKTIDYQYEIVRNQTSQNAYSLETLKQLVLLMKLVQYADAGKFAELDKKSYKITRAKVEELARNWSTVYHREAQQTKNADLYSKAFYLYREYLKTFTDSPKLYSMTFFYGELLYKLQKWKPAAETYEKALAINDKGKYTKELVYSIVLAYFKVVSVSESKAQLEDDAKKIVKDETDDKKPKKVEIPKKKKIPATHNRLVIACERYVKYAPDGERIVDVKYTMARIFYDHNHLKKAVEIFKDIAYKHSKHRLAVIAANLHLDSLNLLQDYDGLEKAVAGYLEKKPIKDEVFISELTALYAAISFKKCTVYDDKEQWKQAANCFVAFYRNFPKSEYVDKALYNAALDFERMRDLGKAIRVRIFLLQATPESELAPKTLYNIGGNYHALAIYSRAAKFYELFVRNFPKHEKAEDALANASTFRQGLGQYKKAIAAYEKYLELFKKKKPKRAAEVFFQIAKIYEKQNKKRKAFDQYTLYLSKWAKKGTDDHKLEAHLKLGMFFWQRAGSKNRQKALAEFERTLKEYNKLNDSAKAAMTVGRDSAAQAMFMMGEDVFQKMAKMDINSKNEKELQKRLKKKLAKAVEAKKIYEKVILFKRPDWAIASLYRIGSNMEELANTIRGSRCPKRLTYDQCEIYKGILEDNAKRIEDDAVSYYIKSLSTATKANWFNKYTKLAEFQLARLRPKQYRKPSELRAMPNHVQRGFTSVAFITNMKDEDRLQDMNRGNDESDADDTGSEESEESKGKEDAQ